MKSKTIVMWAPAKEQPRLFTHGASRLTACLPGYHAVAVSVTFKPLTKKQRMEIFGQ